MSELVEIMHKVCTLRTTSVVAAAPLRKPQMSHMHYGLCSSWEGTKNSGIWRPLSQAQVGAVAICEAVFVLTASALCMSTH